MEKPFETVDGRKQSLTGQEETELKKGGSEMAIQIAMGDESFEEIRETGL